MGASMSSFLFPFVFLVCSTAQERLSQSEQSSTTMPLRCSVCSACSLAWLVLVRWLLSAPLNCGTYPA